LGKKLLDQDLPLLKREVAKNMPDPTADRPAWRELMLSDFWVDVVDRLFFARSILDKSADSEQSTKSDSRCRCGICSVCFPTDKALCQPACAKHKVKNLVHSYLASGTCPACEVDFVTRARCSAHIGDRRRPKCRDAILSGIFPMIDASLVEKIDDRDRELDAARKLGKTHVVADMPAKAACGRILGRIAPAPLRPKC